MFCDKSETMKTSRLALVVLTVGLLCVGNAIAQAKVICIQKGGNALMNVNFDDQGTDTWGTNAWESIALSADVIKVK